MDQIKIGSFLKELRKGKGLTQEQLAEQLNVSNRSVSRWETGSTLPDISILIELAEFYEVDIKEIIDGERKSESMEKELVETLEKVGEYTGNEKKQIIKLLKLILSFALGSFTLIYMTIICGVSTLQGIMKYGLQGIALVGMMFSFYGIIYLFQLQDAMKQEKAIKYQRWGFWIFYIVVFIFFAIVLSCLHSFGII
ncbi:MAG: helix-turn-helix domain-containing protein [Lachnospira sp.]|nr:helix-turn-helix domain-containing protein [Lachnospira sp.]